MKRVICGVVGLGMLVFAVAAQAQSLADVAKDEQARRKSIKHPTRVYTNDDVRDVKPISTMGQEPKGQAVGSEGAAGAEGVGEGAGGAGAAKGAGAPTVGGGSEGQWRERMAAAREQLSRARIQLEAMRARVGRLAGASVRAASEAEQSDVQRQQQETLQEYDRLRADVERYERAVAEVEEQARQAGVPPGWLH
jgi:hypothetical protein